MAFDIPTLTIQTLQTNVLNIIVSLIAGLFVLVIGYAVAVVVEAILKKSFTKAKVEEKLKEHNLQNALLGFTLTGLLTGLIKWIVFLWFLVSAVSIIESAFTFGRTTTVLTAFLIDFVAFLPSLLQGILILVAGFLIAEFLRAKVREGMKLQAQTLSSAVWIVAIYFTVTIALSNPAYGINVGIITQIFNYFILAVALGLGGGMAIAIGLGLKDSIARIAKKHEHGIEKAVATKMK